MDRNWDVFDGSEKKIKLQKNKWMEHIMFFVSPCIENVRTETPNLNN